MAPSVRRVDYGSIGILLFRREVGRWAYWSVGGAACTAAVSSDRLVVTAQT